LLLGDVSLLFSDGANLRYLASEREVPKKHQFLLEGEDPARLNAKAVLMREARNSSE